MTQNLLEETFSEYANPLAVRPQPGLSKAIAGMSRHLKQDMEEAYHRLLALSGNVEEMIGNAVKSLMAKNRELALQVIQSDSDIDRTEVRIEEECLKMLALHQPVAADLRRLTTMMKINNDLERMADLACNIAERTSSLEIDSQFTIPTSINSMAEQTIGMVRDSLHAFINLDIDLAFQVIQRDSQVDQLNVQVIDTLMESMRESECISDAINCFSASRHLEQIADHATSVAEDVVYMVNGVIVRHQHSKPTS